MVRPLLGLALLSASSACSFLCTDSGGVDCVTDFDCVAPHTCSAAGKCVVPTATTGPTGTGSLTTTSSSTGSSTGAGSTGGTTTASSGSTGSSTGGTGGPLPCAQTGSCCQAAWSQGDPACAAVSVSGTPPGSLYATSNDNNTSFGIYQITLGASPTATLLVTATSGTNIDALAVVPGSPLTFVLASFDGISEFVGGAFTALPTPPPASQILGLAFLPGSNVLAIGTNQNLIGVPFPPGASWGNDVWASNNNGPASGFAVPVGQLVTLNGSTLVGASAVGALALASNGDICASQGCVAAGNTGVNTPFTGVAADPGSGTIYLVGQVQDGQGSHGVVSAMDSVGHCLWTRVGASICNTAGTLPFACGDCQLDSSLTQKPLLQAGFVQGTLYISGYGSGAGGPLFSYSKAAGLVSVQGDHTYYSLAVGP